MSEAALYGEMECYSGIVVLHLLAISIGVDDDQGGRPEGRTALFVKGTFLQSSTIRRKEEEEEPVSVSLLFQIRKFPRRTHNSKKYEYLSPLPPPGI